MHKSLINKCRNLRFSVIISFRCLHLCVLTISYNMAGPLLTGNILRSDQNLQLLDQLQIFKGTFICWWVDTIINDLFNHSMKFVLII